MKTCSKCGTVYPSTAEYFNKQDLTHLKGQCKQCDHGYYILTKEHNNAVSAQYYAIHKIEILARKRAIYLDQHPREQRPKDSGWQPLEGRYPEIERQIRQYALSR